MYQYRLIVYKSRRRSWRILKKGNLDRISRIQSSQCSDANNGTRLVCNTSSWASGGDRCRDGEAFSPGVRLALADARKATMEAITKDFIAVEAIIAMEE